MPAVLPQSPFEIDETRSQTFAELDVSNIDSDEEHSYHPGTFAAEESAGACGESGLSRVSQSLNHVPQSEAAIAFRHAPAEFRLKNVDNNVHFSKRMQHKPSPSSSSFSSSSSSHTHLPLRPALCRTGQRA